MKCAIAVFAKTVGMSPVKTRLAARIGAQEAEAFYQLSVNCVEATVLKAAATRPDEIFPFWAMAEEHSPRLGETDGFPAIWTGEGNLGTRLANVSETLGADHDAVMMMGTDSPQIDAQTILEALDRLNEPETDAVSGPAYDGGYYLFVSGRPVERKLWEAVTYSASTTLAEFEALLEGEGHVVRRIATMQDVDEVDDLVSLQSRLEARSLELSEPQGILLEWLREHSGEWT